MRCEMVGSGTRRHARFRSSSDLRARANVSAVRASKKDRMTRRKHQPQQVVADVIAVRLKVGRCSRQRPSIVGVSSSSLRYAAGAVESIDCAMPCRRHQPCTGIFGTPETAIFKRRDQRVCASPRPADVTHIRATQAMILAASMRELHRCAVVPDAVMQNP